MKTTRAQRPVILPTVMRASGDTGVQTHQTTFARYLKGVGRTVRFATPFDAPRWQSTSAVGVRRCLEPVAPTLAVRWYRAGHHALVRRAVRDALRGVEDATLYAQCPVSASAALLERRPQTLGQVNGSSRKVTATEAASSECNGGRARCVAVA